MYTGRRSKNPQHPRNNGYESDVSDGWDYSADRSNDENDEREPGLVYPADGLRYRPPGRLTGGVRGYGNFHRGSNYRGTRPFRGPRRQLNRRAFDWRFSRYRSNDDGQCRAGGQAYGGEGNRGDARGGRQSRGGGQAYGGEGNRGASRGGGQSRGGGDRQSWICQSVGHSTGASVRAGAEYIFGNSDDDDYTATRGNVVARGNAGGRFNAGGRVNAGGRGNAASRGTVAARGIASNIRGNITVDYGTAFYGRCGATTSSCHIEDMTKNFI